MEAGNASGDGGGKPRRAPFWRRSLLAPLVLLVLAVNVAAFAATFPLIEAAARADRRELSLDYSMQFAEHLADVVDAKGELRPAPLLDWRGWRKFDDVIVTHAPRKKRDGTYVVDGVHLNPLGSSHRDALFNEQRTLALISDAIGERGPVESAFGTAVPIRNPAGGIWGGAWITGQALTDTKLPALVLPVMLVTVVLMTGVLLWLFRRTVLDPVEELAAVARRLESGDLAARVVGREGRVDEIGQLASGFNDMATRLERYSRDLEDAVAEATEQVKSAEAAAMTQRRLAATGELAAGIAHELNNPLGGLVNAVETLKRGDVAPERRAEYLDLVSHGLHRMGETVGRLLRLSPRAAEVDDVELWRPLGDALGLVRHRADRLDVDVDLLGPDDGPRRPAFADDALVPYESLPILRGAANELGQALLNLLVNALDAIEEAREAPRVTRGPGRIELTLRRTAGGDALELVCADDGPGVSEDVLARAAHAFFTTKSQGKGTGLGLAIVHNVVAAHGGRVLLDSAPGDGFRVTLELPLRAHPDEGTAP